MIEERTTSPEERVEKASSRLRLDRHDIDVVSLVFGSIYAGLGLAFLMGDLDVARLNTPVVIAVSLAAVGLVLVAFGLRSHRR